ncbi:hypothetical protein [Photorhabdus temperata]|uniref:hypothetical protein n=1 Tax=Photorhabdus temperata TaxID=574560 RepID=UPI0012DF325A|nr:hypothetical protein [Photorhabdus temperata]
MATWVKLDNDLKNRISYLAGVLHRFAQGTCVSVTGQSFCCPPDFSGRKIERWNVYRQLTCITTSTSFPVI